jgi:hypothetical protein
MIECGFYNYYSEYNNNRMFDPSFKSTIGDDLSYTLRYLADEAKKKGVHVSTIDTQPLDKYDVIIFFDFPTEENRYFKQLIKMKFENMYLCILENELIRPDNWKNENYRYFKRVFTWNDTMVDNKKKFKFFLANRIPKDVSFDPLQKTKLCCMIAGNKSSTHRLELYSERIRAIRWFENNAPGSFDLYGYGWDIYSFSGVLSPLNRVWLLTKLFAPRFPSYKGNVTSKHEILEQYKFSICYENARDIPGYITEKIFDCFFAGCIPVYWGAPNITDYIPESTFIDRRNFKTYNELYSYMKNMTSTQYKQYIDSIQEFVKGQQIYPFSAENFCATIIELCDK